jgi:hypothetical protein
MQTVSIGYQLIIPLGAKWCTTAHALALPRGLLFG